MAYLYWLRTPKGRYVGKLTSQKPVEDHTRRLWDKFTKLIQAPNTDSAASDIIESDPEALGQLENNWCQHVLKNGFNTEGDNMFIKGAGVAEESKFATWHNLGNFGDDEPSLKGQSIFAWLQLVWNRAPYEVIEALLIMAAAKETGVNALHNTQIDFLGRTGSPTLTQNSVITSFLSQTQFQTKIQQMSAKLPKLEETIHFESDFSLKDKPDLMKALCDPEVLQKVVDAIERARSQSTKQTKKTKKKKAKKGTSKKQIKEGTEKMFRGISTTFSANNLANLSIWLSKRMLDWYSTITFPAENDFQLITDLKTGYTNIISKKIQQLFAKVFDGYSRSNTAFIRKEMKTNSVFANWPYVADSNWDTFYHQQLAMYYRGKYGPLVLLRQEEDGLYVFSRKDYTTKKGRNRKLFTSDEDIRPIDDQVNGNWNNVEIW